MAACSIPGCEQLVHVKKYGYCAKHYARWYKTGDPLQANYDRGQNGPDRWRTRYQVDENGCWIWTGTIDRAGYGEIQAFGRKWRAHRLVYTQLIRELGAAEELDHLCRVHACVNPEHLEPVSHAVNVARGKSGSWNKEKTHCKNGHEFTPENTINNHGGRGCRTCAQATQKERTRRYRDRKKAGLV